MIRLLMIASIHIRDFMRRYMPSNILLDRIRTRRGLKWGIPAVLLAIPYFAVAHWCTTIIGNDGPGWLNLALHTSGGGGGVSPPPMRSMRSR
ncbi:hypothetical protein PCC79_03730 [Propioniciclava soli]|uniref:Uncharacterized protein n=1 Tax=Propioniciclava soli TaxID=2775081 RepID=A0ABZ3C9D3_9ACTN